MLARRLTRGAVAGLALSLLIVFAATLSTVGQRRSLPVLSSKRTAAIDRLQHSPNPVGDVANMALEAVLPGADASGTKWVTKQIGWASSQAGAGKALGGGGLDTCFITDEADTQRTIIVNTADWAWEEIGRENTSSGATLAGAYLTLTAQKSNGAADSVYAIMEPCTNGTCGRAAANGLAVFTTSTSWPLLAGGGGNGAYTYAGGSAAYTLLTPPAIVFQGAITIDPDTWVTSGNAWLRQGFRILIIGDVGGTTPQLNACRLYLTYPQRAQP